MFTPREEEIVRLLVERGMTSKEVASELNMSTKTAETHRSNIMRKLSRALGRHGSGYRQVNAVDLALYAVSHELVDMRMIESKYGAGIPCPS